MYRGRVYAEDKDPEAWGDPRTWRLVVLLTLPDSECPIYLHLQSSIFISPYPLKATTPPHIPRNPPAMRPSIPFTSLNLIGRSPSHGPKTGKGKANLN
jgi:hypothetical protein